MKTTLLVLWVVLMLAALVACTALAFIAGWRGEWDKGAFFLLFAILLRFLVEYDSGGRE